MGNRAIVKPVGKDVGVYLHWNGGIDSVTAFLKYCELRDFRSFEDSYGLARFTQVVGNFLGGGLSIGVHSGIGETQLDAAYLDNGIYIVKGWEIVGHIGEREPKEGYDLEDMLRSIDSRQPESEQLGDFLDGVETDISDIEVGDIVFVQSSRGNYEKWEVIGIGEDEYVNGRNVLGIPYVNKYYNGPTNPNNYLRGKVRRVIK